jgi:hypothetical protein
MSSSRHITALNRPATGLVFASSRFNAAFQLREHFFVFYV